jgi:ubiquinone/menaquinone biosynthesis C-methylase UbiE
MSNIHNQVKAQFSKTSEAYVNSVIHAKGEDLQQVLGLAGDVQDKSVLDVATGGGHTALAFAKAGAKVTATDLTPQMLVKAREFLQSQSIHTVIFQEASAEQLPFAEESFDIVTCRIAAHHFADSVAFVGEVARVLKPFGQLFLIDNISPVNRELSEVMNKIEKWRDPSHVWACSIPYWVECSTKAGLEIYSLSRFKRKKNYGEWVKNAQTPSDVVQELEAYVLSLPPAYQGYFEVVEDNQKLISLSHEVMILQANKTG